MGTNRLNVSLYNKERPTGALRKADREFLQNPDTYGEDGSEPRQTRYIRRSKTKERIAHALIDFAALTSLDKELRDNILDGAVDEFLEYEGTDAGTLPAALSLLYELVMDHYAKQFSGNHSINIFDEQIYSFENELTRAVEDYHTRRIRDTGDTESWFVEKANVEIDDPKKLTLADIGEKIDRADYHNMTREELLATVDFLSSRTEEAPESDTPKIQNELGLMDPLFDTNELSGHPIDE